MASLQKKTRLYDVVIIGAGFAGLCLACQLVRDMPDIRLAILHDTSFPNQAATHKVGESTVEIGAYYLGDILGLKEYLESQHILKMGLRFIQTESGSYKELGITDFPWNDAYQLDRGILENHLYDLAKEESEIYQEHRFVDFEEKQGLKIVKALTKEGKEEYFHTRWVVDASGRGRSLIKKNSLATKTPYPMSHSAVWFRVDGAVDVNDIYSSEEPENIFFQRKRSNSTIHLMGEGYWIWLIPLAGNKTSIGIVFDEKIIDGRKLLSQEEALSFIKENEAFLYDYLKEREYQILDFKYYRKYSYIAEKFISEERWALTGEACGFVDPLYSNGTDMIAFSNSLIRNAIYCDLNKERQEEFYLDYEFYNDIISRIYKNFFNCHHHKYGHFKSWYYIFVKTNMDAVIYFGTLCCLYMNRGFYYEYMCKKSEQEKIREITMLLYTAQDYYGEFLDYLNSEGFKETVEKYEGNTPRFIDINHSVEAYINRDIKRSHQVEYDELYQILSKNIDIFKEMLGRLKNGEDFRNIFYDFALYQKYFPDATKM